MQLTARISDCRSKIKKSDTLFLGQDMLARVGYFSSNLKFIFL